MSSVLARSSKLLEQQRSQTRESILAATRELLAGGRAFAGLSVGEISAAAGVSRPTFYAYFQDKRALILALGAEFEHDARIAAEPWLRTETDDLSTTLQTVLAAFTAHRATVGAVVEAATYDTDVAVFWRGFHEWFVLNATERARHADPHLDEQNAEALAYSLVWMTERCFTEHLSAPRVNQTALLSALERLWRTVVPAPSPD